VNDGSTAAGASADPLSSQEFRLVHADSRELLPELESNPLCEVFPELTDPNEATPLQVRESVRTASSPSDSSSRPHLRLSVRRERP